MCVCAVAASGVDTNTTTTTAAPTLSSHMSNDAVLGLLATMQFLCLVIILVYIRVTAKKSSIHALAKVCSAIVSQ